LFPAQVAVSLSTCETGEKVAAEQKAHSYVATKKWRRWPEGAADRGSVAVADTCLPSLPKHISCYYNFEKKSLKYYLAADEATAIVESAASIFLWKAQRRLTCCHDHHSRSDRLCRLWRQK
jgi:hypothetical protein